MNNNDNSNAYPTPVLPPQPSAPMGDQYDHSGGVGTTTSDANRSNVLDYATTQELLQQGYTTGLINAIQLNKQLFYHTYWIVDNSGSMLTLDGHRMIYDTKKSKLQIISGCSRWKEMVDTIEYHIRLAAIVQKPTTFRLLNHPGQHIGSQVFSIASSSSLSNTSIDHELATALHIIHETQPNGVTPLTEHLYSIRQSIEPIADTLRRNGQKVAIVIATDGCPTDMYGNRNHNTDNEFRNALRSLESLPIWIVVRLCTDEDAIVQYWNDIDSVLEINIEVLDDYTSEAKEVYEKNPWFTYSLPIHRMREMGYYNKLFDMMDEQPLSKNDIHQFIKLLYGPFDCTVDPDLDWNAFCTIVEQVQNRYHQQQHQQQQKLLQWNPIHQKLMHYIDIKKLRYVGQNNKSSHWSLFGMW